MDLSPCAVLIEYQARGARQKRREALCMPDRVGWLREKLERHHGSLARFDVIKRPAQIDHENGAENDDETLAAEPTATSSTIDLTEMIRDRRHGTPEQAPQHAVSMDESIGDWLRARLASLSCTQVRIETHQQKAA